MEEFIREHKRGLIGTVVFHASILILLLLMGFFTPLPLPGEEGILVNFGDSETGLGVEEPSPSRDADPPATVQSQREEVVPVTTPPPTPVRTQPKPVKEEVMTQDFEESAAVEAANRKKREEERIRQQEIERQRLAELERQRVEAEARRKQEEEQRRISEINSRTKGAFGKSNTGSGGTGSGTGQSQGVTFPGGNQGVPTGDPNAGNYGPGGSGGGNQGTGPSYSLAGRSARSLPKPNYPGSEEGVVVVQITVDKFGNVTKAEPGARGSTTMNTQLLSAAQKAALQAKFNLDNNAPAFQTGTITYRFVLD